MLQLREKLQLLETSWPICSWCCCYHQQGGVQLGGAAQAFSWACLSCPVPTQSHLCYSRYTNRQWGKKEAAYNTVRAPCAVDHSEGKPSPEQQQLLFAAHRGECKREGERGWAELCLCVCPHGLVLSCSTSEAMQRHCCICWASAGPFHSAGSSWACLDTCCGCEGTSVITCCFPGKF